MDKQAQWETVSPPKTKGRYLITLQTPFGRQVRIADRVEYPKGNWVWSILPSGMESDKSVIAWQKCPEPYNH